MSQLGRANGPGAPTRSPGQAGFTLLEIVIAVMLISMVVLGLATGFLTLVRTNSATWRQQQVDHAANNYAESLKAVQYEPCVAAGSDPDYGASPDVWAPEGDIQVRVIDVQYWNPDTDEYQDTCPSADAGTQLVTVRSEWNERDRQAQIVKRNR